MKKPISTQLTQANITTVIDILTQTPHRLEDLSTPLSPEQLRQPLGIGERSFIENLAHLINCEERSTHAIYLALLAAEPLFLDLHPERQWGKLLRYDLFEFTDLLAYFTFRRRVLLRVLHELTDVQWARGIREPGKQRKESVYWRARATALHELEHLTDLDSKLVDLKQE